jgi:hypothetical protein
MMEDNIASLTSSDSWWGSFLVISTVIVLLGVAAEAIQLITFINRHPKLKHALEMSALLVLIVGIAGELIGEAKTISIGDQISLTPKLVTRTKPPRMRLPAQQS